MDSGAQADEQTPELDIPSEPVAEFLARKEKELSVVAREAAAASWIHSTYINEDSSILGAKLTTEILGQFKQLSDEAKKYLNLENDAESQRIIEGILYSATVPAPSDPELQKELSQILTEMESIYGSGEYCFEENECYSLPELEAILSESPDYNRKLAAWEGWRTVSPEIRPLYNRMVELVNLGAKDLGMNDSGELWRSGYDMPEQDLRAEVDRLWDQVKPMYNALHCHVRDKLSDIYGENRVPRDRPIPAHVLGNMWSQTWENIFDQVKPFPEAESIDITTRLKAQGYDAVAITKLSESFFTSIGMPELPQSFWERSLLIKPDDRKVVCHASAWDIDAWEEVGGEDVRVKQCVEVTEEHLRTMHHELGHVYYFLMYKWQRPFFRGGAHDGFHEAVGDTILLSMTPEYLKKVHIIDDYTENYQVLINNQMKAALEKIAFFPFSRMIEEWRWRVFSGEIAPEDYNKKWWELRTEYQGIEAPILRTEKDFDPGAKYHIPANVPYLRYFLSFVMQFQFHKALCQEAGYEGDLHNCSIYQNVVAGDKLSDALALGASQPWQDTMELLAGQRTMDASAIIEYFTPLLDWLGEQNEGRTCGW